MRFYRWDQYADSRETDRILLDVAQVLASRLPPHHSPLKGAVDAGDVAGVCAYSPSYELDSPETSFTVRQITALFSKRSDIDLGVDRREAAIRTYLAAEELCHETNTLFRMRDSGRFSFPPGVESAIFAARRKISYILGPCPSLEDLKFRFGPGATTTLPKRMASPRAKLSDELTCSASLLGYLDRLADAMPHFLKDGDGNQRIACVMPARLDFVRKTAKTDRAIAVEPLLNSMVQLGLGDVIARRLSRFGIDIRDQSRNQRAARDGSITGALATLDLSSASDTIASRLVFELLPDDWFELLDCCRSDLTTYKGLTFSTAKFSSMGNGFTFPLETLIFYCLALAAGDAAPGAEGYLAYGDDLVVPSEVFHDLSDLLHALGFIVNPTKSFSSGPFRESCGCDYVSGTDIRPLYVKGPLHGFDLFRLHNFFEERYDDVITRTILSYIDPSLRIYGPRGYGCGHLNGATSLRPSGRRKGWGGYTFSTYSFRTREDFRPQRNDRVLPLYTTYIREDTVAIPDQTVTSDGFFVIEPLWALHDEKTGLLGTTVPGTKGYNRITVYTLHG